MAMRKIKPEGKPEMVMDANPMPYPSVSFDLETLPEAKDWKVGKTYNVNLNVKMRSVSQHKGPDQKEHGHYGFDIVGIESKGEVKGKTTRYA